jgi:hypothetical protein
MAGGYPAACGPNSSIPFTMTPPTTCDLRGQDLAEEFDPPVERRGISTDSAIATINPTMMVSSIPSGFR